MKCKHCGGNLINHNDWYVMPKYQHGEGLLDSESWHCYRRTDKIFDPVANQSYQMLLPHEPMTKADYLKKYKESINKLNESLSTDSERTHG